MHYLFYLLFYLDSGLRHDIPEKCPSYLRYLIQDCWSEVPDMRPSFAQIIQAIQQKQYTRRTSNAHAFDEKDISLGEEVSG